MKNLVVFSLACLALALVAPLFLREAFFHLPAYSDGFDCDDGTLFMIERLQSMGITSVPVLGNLNKSGEAYLDSDHVWVMADIAGRQIAFDKGVFYLDRQHYEGFKISDQMLLDFVVQDLKTENTDIRQSSN